MRGIYCLRYAADEHVKQGFPTKGRMSNMKHTVRSVLTIACLVSLQGCVGGNMSYIPANRDESINTSNSIEVDKTKEETWNKLLAGLSSSFFVINNMDKQSGFINLSYAGDPEKYIEGGEISSSVSNLRGKRDYRFPASRAYQEYEAVIDGNLVGITRKLDLEGRINILLSEVSPNRTRLTVNTRYILNLRVTGQNALRQSLTPHEETISFNGGGSAKTSGGGEYRSNGNLEQTIIDLLK